MRHRFTFIISLLFLFAGCAAPETTTPEPTATLVPPTSTPVPPTNTPRPSCEIAEETCLELTFDDESCTYEGPTELAPGPVRLFFHNDSEEVAAVNFVKLLEGKTSEDLFRRFQGKETMSGIAPSWTQPLGTWKPISAGTTEDWVRTLEPGNYHMVCARMKPQLVWRGAGLTVEE